MAVLSQDELASALARVEPIKIGTLVYRTVPFKYANSVSSVKGSIEHGGRFNAPLRLARSICNLEHGFGLLYTATNPLACLFECGHILRGGLREGEFQRIPVEPTILVSFKVQADNVLNLRATAVQQILKIERSALCSLDYRSVANSRGGLTHLQTIGVAVLQSDRFSGILTPSRFADVIPSFCFNFLPGKVLCELLDQMAVLKPYESLS